MRIPNAFEEIFCLRSDLSNHHIISAKRPGLKTGMDLRGLVWSENGCRKRHFWSEIGSGFGEPGGTPPPRIPRSTPRVKITLVKVF